jgi:glutamate--cysteine ligase
LPFVFEDGFGFERWVDYALDVPMYFVYRDGRYIDALGQSFRDFMKGELPALPGEVPTLSDWADHLTTICSPRRGSRNSSKCAAPMADLGGGFARCRRSGSG